METRRGSFSVFDKTLNVLTVDFERIVYIWVGDASLAYRELHCGFPLKGLQGEDCVGSTLIGDLDSISADLSKALAKRFDKAVFMSFNVEEADHSTLSVVQERFFETIFGMYPQYARP